jgi:hypothetical protein
MRDAHAAAGRTVRTGDAPHRVVDAHGADAVDDRTFEREHAADIAVGAAIEERAVGGLLDLAGEMTNAIVVSSTFWLADQGNVKTISWSVTCPDPGFNEPAAR